MLLRKMLSEKILGFCILRALMISACVDGVADAVTAMIGVVGYRSFKFSEKATTLKTAAI